MPSRVSLPLTSLDEAAEQVRIVAASVALGKENQQE